ncbi:hypothetical protein BSLG_010707 [Batrachochytrium salamandrivorans]|nr:hypothetical protein BSLG_010707 [Batrachochytrium salamandrivorans]
MYGVPLHEGVPIENLHAAAHIKNDQVFFYSATISIKKQLTKRSPTTSKSRAVKSSKEAVDAAVKCLGVPFYRDIAPLRDNPMTRWLQVKVNANTGSIVSMEDFKMGFTYMAIKLPNKSPEDRFSTIIDPENIQSSPEGWTKGYKLAGNNAGYFTESAGNFQQKNFGRGGKDGGSISIDIQNSDEEDNASFLSPPDGQYGVLYLHLYTATKPNRDPALDNTILTHELTHGLSSRLTGGAHDNLCMEDVQSGGLNEGYSDMVSLIFTTKPEDTRNTRRVIGGYVEGNLRGLRKYPYTTNIKVNPLTYKDAVGEKDRYILGAIWATMLLEVYWNFVDAYEFSTNLHDATQKG